MTTLNTVADAIVADLEAAVVANLFTRTFEPRYLRYAQWDLGQERGILRVDVVPLKAPREYGTRDHIDTTCHLDLVQRYKFGPPNQTQSGEAAESELRALDDLFQAVQLRVFAAASELGLTKVDERFSGRADDLATWNQWTGLARITVDVGGV